MAQVSASTQHARLTMSGIVKRFGATVALGGVDLRVDPGEVHALVGENGAGKSTLMKVLAGAIQPDAGAMALDGEAYRPRGPHHARRSGVMMIYQELSLAPHLSVQENIMLGVEHARMGVLNVASMRRKTRDALDQLGHGNIAPHETVGRLSSAQQQIVEIARALAVGCRVLVLDEPTSSLAHEDIGRLFDLIERLRSSGHAVIYISHFLEEVKQIADRFTVLRDGETVGGGDARTTPQADIVDLMVGRKVDDLYPRSAHTSGDVVLRVERLSGKRAPEQASFELHAGEVLGIAGLVGAGRTEMLRVLFGLDRGAGRVSLRHIDGLFSPMRRWRQGVGMVSESRKEEGLALDMSIADNLTLAGLGRVSRAGVVMPGAQQASASRWVDKLQVRCAGTWQSIGQLSGGNQQKVAVARLLHSDVDVLLLDEPTRGIDVGSKAQIYRLIDELACAGKAILLVSSYLPELLGVCDRIAVMRRGRLGEARPVAECTQHDLMMQASAGGDDA